MMRMADRKYRAMLLPTRCAINPMPFVLLYQTICPSSFTIHSDKYVSSLGFPETFTGFLFNPLYERGICYRVTASLRCNRRAFASTETLKSFHKSKTDTGFPAFRFGSGACDWCKLLIVLDAMKRREFAKPATVAVEFDMLRACRRV